MVSVRLEAITKNYGGARSAGGLGGVAWFGHLLGGAGKSRVAAPEEPVKALDDLYLSIVPGETLSVVGPSGCGKTTLLRVIAGLEPPDSGRIYFDQTDVSDLSPGERGIGLVFQSYALYPNMTGKENVSFFLKVHRRQAEVEERVRLTAEMLGVGFEQLLSKKPPKLSPGQQQRVAIGRCITRDPTVFLFDEPLSNVDAKVRVQTRVVIKRLLSRFGITSLYVTHDQTEAVALGDRLAVMRAGKIEQIGTYAQLFERPDNLFVAGFLGLEPMSFFPGTKHGERLLLGREDATIPLPVHLANLAPDGATLVLGVRAKDVLLSSASAEDELRGIVEVVEVLPAERYQLVHLRVAGVPCQAHFPREQTLKHGFVTRVDFNPQHLYLFDEPTGARLWPR
ncbi:MAG: ABC transporter ATP-binding protein [Chloroflexota bacterium]